MKFRVLTLVSVFLLYEFSHAQNYAVRSTVQLLPPYSVYLSDYATDGNQKLRVILQQGDLSRPVYQLRLVMSVSLNGRVIMRTSRFFNPAPITLDPGVPTVIAGAELAPYVDSRNIDFVGYSKDQYEKTKALPEGSYDIVFTAYDYRRQDQQVSNAGSAFYYLAKNEPPLVNLPACGSQIPLKTPQQIVFSWMPRNTSSPTSAQETEYEFSLYETRPVGRNPNDVVLTSQPIFRIRTDLTQIIYGPAEPMLLDSMVYVWRVQAIDRSGKDAFRNSGYSEVCTFKYGGTAPNFDIGIVKGLQAIGETDQRAKIWWQPSDFDAYRVYYKKSGSQWQWFFNEVTKTEFKIFDLEPNNEYEVRVQGKKNGYYSPFTEIIKFRTREKTIAQCGDPAIVAKELGNPLQLALTGMTFKASDHDVTFIDVQNTGQPGWFKGTGSVVLPMLGGTYYVYFDRLYVNENLEATGGRMRVANEGMAKMIEDQLTAQKEKQQEKNREEWAGTDFYEKIISFDYAINDITADASDNLLIGKKNGPDVVNTEVPAILTKNPDKAIILQGKDGNQYVVQKKDGQTKITKVEGGGLSPGSDTITTTTVQADSIKDKIIVLVLEQFEEEISAWLRVNGKGGEDDPDVYLAEALPSCFERDAKFLKYVNENTIPYFKEHPAELRAKIESNQAKKTLFNKIAALFKSKDDVDLKKLNEVDKEEFSNSTCEIVNESALVIIDRLIACLAGATIDVGLQYTFKWVELWMDDKPVSFTDYKAVFGALDASQVAVSASIACAAAMIPIVPSSKNKLIVAVVAGLGDGAYAMANNIYKQYDELEAKYPNASVGKLIAKINWQDAVMEGGVNFVITGITTGVVLYAKGNPKFVNFARQLEDKIKRQGTVFLEKAGLSKESIDVLLNKLGIRNIRTFLLQLPTTPLSIRNGNINVTDHWSKFATSFDLDEGISQAIRQSTGSSIADLAEEGVIKQFTSNGFVPFITKYGGNNGLDALLANSNDLASATRVILLEIKSSTTNSVPFSVSLGSGYGGYQLDDIWLGGVITKMTGSAEVDKSIRAAGQALRRIYDINASIIEKYVIEVDGEGLARVIRIN